MTISFYDMKLENKLISDEINSVVLETLASGHFILGPKLEMFESQFARYCQSKYCFGVGNGLDALTLALRAANIGPGDNVIIPAHTFIATALAVIATGAEPTLVDVDPETYVIDPRELEKINAPTIKAVIPVHLYGNPCDMDEINRIAKLRKWTVIEDNAQAHGAVYKGKKTGSLGHLAGASFYPTKNLGAFGDGGAITTNSDIYAENIACLRNYGQKEKYNHLKEGVNSRLDDIQSAILSIKLKYLDENNKKRNQIANRYLEQLKGVGDLKLPKTTPDSSHVYHLFVIATEKRNQLQSYLTKKGITSLIHYPKATHQHPAFHGKDWNKRNKNFPCSQIICETVLSLPIYPNMPKTDIDIVCQTITDFFSNKI